MARASTPTGRQGGVAIFAQQKYTLLPCACAPEVLSLYKNARWVHAAIPLAVIGANSKRFLHIISFCNLSGRDQGLIKTNRNRFLEKAFTHANRLGQQPVIICMDANTSIANSHCMSLAVAAGTWIDLGSHFSNGKPSPTSSSRKTRDKHSWGKHATRPDFIFANGPALSIIDSFQIRRDLAPKGHLGLEIIVNLDWVDNTLRMIKHPKCFPNQSSSSIEEQEATAAKVLLKWRKDFDQAKHDPDSAWHIFAQIAEEYLRTIHAGSKYVGEGGRHSTIRFRQMTVTQSAASKKHPAGSGTFALNKAYKVQRQCKELQIKLQKLSISDSDSHAIQILETCIRQFARRLGRSFHPDIKLTPSDIDEFDEQLTTQYIQTLRDSQVKKRISAWKSALRTDCKSGGRKAFAWLKDEWRPPLNAVTTNSGAVAVTPQDMVDCLQSDWDRLFNQETKPSWDQFKNNFHDFLTPFPCHLNDITASDILNHVKHMSNHRALQLMDGEHLK